MRNPNFFGYYPDTTEEEESVESWLNSTAESLLKGEVVKVGLESWHLSDAIAEIDGDFLAGKLSVLYQSEDKRGATYDLFETALRPAARILAARILPRLVLWGGE